MSKNNSTQSTRGITSFFSPLFQPLAITPPSTVNETPQQPEPLVQQQVTSSGSNPSSKNTKLKSKTEISAERKQKQEVAFTTGINPYFIAGKPPSSDFREFKTVYKNHTAKLKPWIVYDESKGGLITCKWCEAFPLLAPTDAITKGWHGEPTKGYVSQTLKAHWENRAHEKCGRHFNGEVTSGNKIPTLLENQLQKNIIVEEGKVSQVQRLVNTVHLMAKHNISNAIYEPLIRLQTANGADMGTQYFSPESFKQLVTGLDTEVLKQIIEELVGNDFFSFSGDGATDVAKLS